MNDDKKIEKMFQQFMKDILVSLAENTSAIQKMQARVEAIEENFKVVRAAGQEFWQKEAALLLAASKTTSWTMNASDQNYMFADVYECEHPEGGSPRRWVGKSGVISGRLAIARANPLRFFIDVETFADDTLARSFALSVDGEPVAWDSATGNKFIASLPPSERPVLDFSLSVSPDLIPPDRDVSFCFRSMAITPL